LGQHTRMPDSDNVRHGLNRGLGFTEANHVEDIRRVVEVAKLMTEARIIVPSFRPTASSAARFERWRRRETLSKCSSTARSKNASGVTQGSLCKG
jgi:adenylylsulfate kinase-like enzyme